MKKEISLSIKCVSANARSCSSFLHQLQRFIASSFVDLSLGVTKKENARNTTVTFRCEENSSRVVRVKTRKSKKLLIRSASIVQFKSHARELKMELARLHSSYRIVKILLVFKLLQEMIGQDGPPPGAAEDSEEREKKFRVPKLCARDGKR